MTIPPSLNHSPFPQPFSLPSTIPPSLNHSPFPQPFRALPTIDTIDSEGRDRGAVSGARSKKRGRGDTREIDPLDPTGKQGGKWSDGLVQVCDAFVLPGRCWLSPVTVL